MQCLTIGTSTQSFDEFALRVRTAGITRLIDIRATPGSRRYPQFNEDYLEPRMRAHEIGYYYLGALGGMRHPYPGSVNSALENDELRGYADYMQGDSFHAGLRELVSILREPGMVGIMCSCGKWQWCHRRLIADSLGARKWQIGHVEFDGRISPHHLHPMAKIWKGKILYPEPLA